MGDDLLEQVRTPGGSLEEKLENVIEVFRASQRHLESCRQALRQQALEMRQKEGKERLPVEVEEVISGGTYLDSFLEAYDGQTFLLHSEEIVPCHEYRLALEVNSGGAYWKGISVQEEALVRHNVQAVAAANGLEGSMNIISQFGAAQRGAVFAWRWQHVLDAGPYNLPEWLERSLSAEGNDPLRKLQAELEAVRRWEHQVQQDTCKYIKKTNEVKDIYIREVLRLWPSETDHQGFEVCKKCAWVEGLDAALFTGRNILVQRVAYDDSHSLALHACIARRQVDDKDKEKGQPPYRLITTWVWTQDPPRPAENAGKGVRPHLDQAQTSLTTNAAVSRTMSIPQEMARQSVSNGYAAEHARPASTTSVPGAGGHLEFKPVPSGYVTYAGLARPSTTGSLSRQLVAKAVPASNGQVQMAPVPVPVPTPMANISAGAPGAGNASPKKVWLKCSPPVGMR